MGTDDRMIRDQISLAGAYHYAMALAYLIGGAALLVYAILPRLGLSSAQTLFPPIIGLLLAGLLSVLYGTIGRGLGRLSNGARMGAIFLALLGSVGGAFAVMGSISSAIQAQAPLTSSQIRPSRRRDGAKPRETAEVK